MTPESATLILLHQLSDTGELVFSTDRPATGSIYDGHWHAWDEAHELAELTYEAWRQAPGREAYTAYRAAQDRADAAQEALARLA